MKRYHNRHSSAVLWPQEVYRCLPQPPVPGADTWHGKHVSRAAAPARTARTARCDVCKGPAARASIQGGEPRRQALEAARLSKLCTKPKELCQLKHVRLTQQLPVAAVQPD